MALSVKQNIMHKNTCVWSGSGPSTRGSDAGIPLVCLVSLPLVCLASVSLVCLTKNAPGSLASQLALPPRLPASCLGACCSAPELLPPALPRCCSCSVVPVPQLNSIGPRRCCAWLLLLPPVTTE